MTTLIFCAAEIAWLTGWGHDTDLHETIANGILILAGSVIGTYVFGAVWDDRNVLALGARPHRRRGPDYPDTPDEGAHP